MLVIPDKIMPSQRQDNSHAVKDKMPVTHTIKDKMLVMPRVGRVACLGKPSRVSRPTESHVSANPGDAQSQKEANHAESRKDHAKSPTATLLAKKATTP
jgi:hypothetical protein